RLVDAFGTYAELEDALLSDATHTLYDDGFVRPWSPDSVATHHLANAVIGPLADADERDLLTKRFVDGDDSVAIAADTLSPEARSVYTLLYARDRTAGKAPLAELPAVVVQDFEALSPLPAIPK